jgi:hypothetical protein
MELIPSLISLCGFGIAFTWVLLVHKAVSAGEKADQQVLAPKPVTRAEPEHASFLRRPAAAR